MAGRRYVVSQQSSLQTAFLRTKNDVLRSTLLKRNVSQLTACPGMEVLIANW